MRGHHIGRNSSDNVRIYGSLNERIAKTLISGKKNRQSIWKLEKIKKSISDFANQVKGGEWKEKQYQEKKKEIAGEVRKLKSRGSNLHLRWKEIWGFEDEAFYGYRGDFEQKKDKGQTDLRNKIESNEFAIATYGENTE